MSLASSRMTVSRRALPAVFFSVFLTVAIGNVRAAEATDGLVEIPMPALASLEPSAGGVVGAAIERFENERGTETGVALGKAYGRLGQVFQAWKLSDAANAAYTNAMLLDPENARWPYYLAFNLETQGAFDESVRNYRLSYRLDEQYPNTLQRTGEALFAAGQLEQARQTFETALAQTPDMAAAALNGLGAIAMREEDYQRAADSFKRALALQPEATGLHRNIAQAYEEMGDSEQAEQHSSQIGDIGVVYKDSWIGMIDARVYDSDYYVQQGIQAVQQGDIDRAMQTFMLALDINPQSADAHARMAMVFGFGEGRADAVQLIDKALALDPDHGLANSLKGAMLAESGNYEDAQAYYFRAVNAEAGNVEYRQQFANGLMRLGDFDAAARQYAEASVMRPDHLGVRYSRAVALSFAGRCDEAMAVIKQAVDINPRVAQTLNARARIFSTCPGASASQHKLALDDAMWLYDQRPDATHSETVAMAMAANGRFDEAMEFQGMAIFEAIKAGDQGSQEALRGNMQRYENKRPAEAPWRAHAQ